MNIIPTALPEVLLLEAHVHRDGRGCFMETYREHWFRRHIADCRFVQENFSRSQQGVLRGIHYQNPHAQGKLIRVLHGEIYDVAVDLRRSSPTFKHWVGIRLNSSQAQQLWIPPGFGHGFYTLSPHAELVYKCTDYYNPESEHSLCWNDAELNIDWQLSHAPQLSPKDAAALPLSQALLFD